MSGPQLTRMSIPMLPRGVRIKEDTVRGRTVLMAPERTVVLDETGIAILELVDGLNSIEQIATILAEKYDAPLKTVGNDTVVFIRDLINRGYLDIRDG
ncbi:MAG: pyrroloquinoline quinone biosynthesis peptide chaperone PqqD [Pseudomonadota bacterium]